MPAWHAYGDIVDAGIVNKVEMMFKDSLDIICKVRTNLSKWLGLHGIVNTYRVRAVNDPNQSTTRLLLGKTTKVSSLLLNYLHPQRS